MVDAAFTSSSSDGPRDASSRSGSVLYIVL